MFAKLLISAKIIQYLRVYEITSPLYRLTSSQQTLNYEMKSHKKEKKKEIIKRIFFI